MRFRGGRWIAALFTLFVARGCYSSVAPVPKIDPGTSDTGLPVDPPPKDDSGCEARRPWEGPGVTGVLPISSTTALVLSGDRYFTAEFETRGADAADPNLGRLIAWRDTGFIEDLWRDAPPAIDGTEPWDDPGVTAVYVSKGGGAQVVISRFRRWVREGNRWIAAGSVIDDWVINDAGPPPLDGQVPWQGPGVTATYYTPGGNLFVVLSQNKGWTRRTSDPDPKNWSWADAGFNLAESAEWQNAPAVEGQRPWEGKGVTTAYFVGPKLFVISVDKMWVNDSRAWVSSGSLKTMSGWSSAPSVGCGS